MEILDRDLLTSDLVGSAELKVKDLIQNGGLKNHWVEIFYKGPLLGRLKSGGKILISTKYIDLSNSITNGLG
jgi:hypothetical protein